MTSLARRWALSALLLGSLPGAVLADAASKNNEGNRLYLQKQYDGALKNYTDAQASRPSAPELHYNIGNVLYRKGEFAKAIEEYRRAQSAADPSLSEAATFNRGNALMMQGQIQEAINAYVQALRARPDDQDAKRNLELALKLLQQQKQQPQDENGQPQEQREPREQPPRPEEAKQEDKKQPQSRPGQMSEEEARQILEALRESEKDGVKKHARATVPSQRRPEVDW